MGYNSSGNGRFNNDRFNEWVRAQLDSGETIASICHMLSISPSSLEKYRKGRREPPLSFVVGLTEVTRKGIKHWTA